MTNIEPFRVHATLLKTYRSPEYRKKVKRLVEATKNLREIPHGSKIPRALPRLKNDATDKEKEAQSKANAFRLELDTICYFIHRDLFNDKFSVERKVNKT